jgi:GxxExxY protein
VYENALFIELVAAGFTVEKQKVIEVYYANKQVGEYYADLVVNDVVIVEIKAHEYLLAEHENQLINYLKATNIEVGYY